VIGNVLGYFDTGSRNGTWTIYVEVLEQSTGNHYQLATPVKVMLNNALVVEPRIDITNGEGACGDFTVGDPVSGPYQAFVPYFSSLRFDVQPPMGGRFHVGTTNPPPVSAGSLRVYPTVPNGGESGFFTLLTGPTADEPTITPLPKCGYIVEAWLTDRTI
jgi:hypothetical protein